MKAEFNEKQKFTQWWLWLILIISVILPFIGVFSNLFFPEVIEKTRIETSSAVIFASVMVFVLVLFLSMKLKTDMDDKVIRMSF